MSGAVSEIDALFLLADTPLVPAQAQTQLFWTILIVDDEPAIHGVTRMVLSGLRFRERSLKFLSAYDGVQARQLLSEHDDIAVILLDVVMETEDAGLQLVRHIRDVLRNDLIRIILRTGQAGQAPERDVVLEYDINDYKEKTELTAQKLSTSVVAALRGYIALSEVAALNCELEAKVAARTGELRDSNLALQHANSSLQDEIAERAAAEMAVQQRNIDLQALNEKLAGTQSQLLQSEKMASVGQLAAGVAHEINNPVGYVYSNFGSLDRYVQNIFLLLSAYQLLENTLPPEHPEVQKLSALKAAIDFDYLLSDTANLLTESREGLNRIQKIVKDLKDFSHLDTPEWQLADIHQSIDSTLNVIASELKYKVEVIKEYGTLPKIRCLAFQLNQVFLNLLINASHSIKEQGRITIKTGCTDEHVWVRITDTGQGISAANLSRIFEPFFTTKPIGVGTGLGLSVSWGIVQAHGGRIEVQSELNRGTVFNVFLPIDAAAQELAAQAVAG